MWFLGFELRTVPGHSVLTITGPTLQHHPLSVNPTSQVLVYVFLISHIHHLKFVNIMPFCLLSAGIKGVGYHAQLRSVLLFLCFFGVVIELCLDQGVVLLGGVALLD